MSFKYVLIVGAALLTSCGQQRVYNADQSPIASLGGRSLADLVQELNEELPCDMWKVDESGPLMIWASEEEMNGRWGYWNQINNRIWISVDLQNRWDAITKFVLLHELGHAMGYDHIDDGSCHVMAPSAAPCYGYNYEERLAAFLQQIAEEKNCLTELGY